MKRYLLVSILLLMVMALGACSDSTSDKEDSYTVDKAVKDGHVVIQYLSSEINEVARGKVKTKNLKKLFAFKQHVEKGKKDKIQITLFNQSGHSATNVLKYDGKLIHYENRFGGFLSPQGSYQCQSMAFISARAQVGVCKNEEGKAFSSLIVLFGEQDKMDQFKSEYLY